MEKIENISVQFSSIFKNTFIYPSKLFLLFCDMLVKLCFCLKQESPRSFKLCTHHKKKKVNYCTVLRSKDEVQGRIQDFSKWGLYV